MDELEQLLEALEDLNSNQIFLAFSALGAKFISQDSEGDLIYNKTAHLAAFKAISESYNQLATEENSKEDLQTEIQKLTGENED